MEMEKENRIQGYLNIRSLRDLQYQKRLLSSRIEHQEVMVMYKARLLWDYMSPMRLLNMGCEALAAHNKSFNVAFRTFSFVKSLIRDRKK